MKDTAVAAHLKNRNNQLSPPFCFDSRLDRESMHLEGKLDKARDSVAALMDRKEVLEATRHATLVKCLEELNDALKGIYRRLTTTVEGEDGKLLSLSVSLSPSLSLYLSVHISATLWGLGGRL